MQKSIIESIFPKPKQPLLPQYDEHLTRYRDDESTSQTKASSRIRLNSNASSARTSDEGSSRNRSPANSRSHVSLQAAPLSASVIHYDDPFIAVDRAAATLQETIQSLLDFQSHALIDRIPSYQNDSASPRSATPTQSTRTGSIRTEQGLRVSGVVPIRQPATKKLTLRGARQGIGKSLLEFIALKDEELRIAQSEKANREVSLDKISEFQSKREAVHHEIGLLRERADSEQYRALRDESGIVEKQIKELEEQLLELKARHRHLLAKITREENSSASQLSSYEGTIEGIDKEIRHFLRRPIVKQGLGPRNLSIPRDGLAQAQDLYALRPERRTLALAREQWTNELELLNGHEADVRREKEALSEGLELWQKAVTQIDEFERSLRQTIKTSNSSTISGILASLDSTLLFLQQTLNKAEANDWTLLVCAIGAELDAFKEARAILAPDEPLPALPALDPPADVAKFGDEENNDVPYADLLGSRPPEDYTSDTKVRNSGRVNDRKNGKDAEKLISAASSNESLNATLKQFPVDDVASRSASSSKYSRPVPKPTNSGNSSSAIDVYPESDDDDPGPDFLVSHGD